jgi:decaprenyl-phosphate phosphoribosyltransferase
VTATPATRVSARGWAEAVTLTARPRQWVKNILVLAAPTLAGRLGDGAVLVNTLIAFVAFCLGASGVYFVNDARDVEEDRAHPRKRLRPVAAGDIAPRAAAAIGCALMVAALGVAIVASWQLLAVLATYEAVSMAYCLTLKNEPVLDIAIIASGFLLRAVAGGSASEIALSQWFLLAASFGSLFIASGKRYAEAVMPRPDGTLIRRSLSRYTETYLRFVWSVSAALLIMTYALWSFEIQDDTDSPWAPISMAPFVLAVLRYAVDVDAGRAGEPEEIALSDRVLQAIGVVWLFCLMMAVYAR